MKYEIIMLNGDRAEAETFAAALTAAVQLMEDAEWETAVEEVTVGGKATDGMWAWRAVTEHVIETGARREEATTG